MSKFYTVFDTASGEILSCAEAANGVLPAQGPTPDPQYAVLHGRSDPVTDRVEHGKIVPKGMLQRRTEQAEKDWFMLRARRRVFLEQTDHKFVGDYPISATEKAALQAKRAASRDLPQTHTDPKAAMTALETIWRPEDVE